MVTKWMVIAALAATAATRMAMYIAATAALLREARERDAEAQAGITTDGRAEWRAQMEGSGDEWQI